MNELEKSKELLLRVLAASGRPFSDGTVRPNYLLDRYILHSGERKVHVVDAKGFDKLMDDIHDLFKREKFFTDRVMFGLISRYYGTDHANKVVRDIHLGVASERGRIWSIEDMTAFLSMSENDPKGVLLPALRGSSEFVYVDSL